MDINLGFDFPSSQSYPNQSHSNWSSIALVKSAPEQRFTYGESYRIIDL